MNHELLATQFPTAVPPIPVPQSVPRVVVVEPDTKVRRALTDLLRVRGMRVVGGTAEPDLALQMVAKWQPTVVVSELRLATPGTNGITLANAVHEVDASLPVIIHSASFAPDGLPADGWFGIFRFVAKGECDELLTAITDAHAGVRG